MKKIILLLLVFAGFTNGFAQEKETRRNKKEERRQRISAISKQEEEGVIKYRKHTVVGAKLTNDGYGGFFEIGRAQSVTRALLFQLEITERKHPKEIKQQAGGFSQNLALIYGKINFFYPVKLGVQEQFLLGNKGNKNGVSVTGNIGGGIIAGLLRPYMLQVDDGQQKFISYYDDTTAFLGGQYIRGPGFGTGWNRMKMTPGIYLKPAIRFDYGKYNEMVNAIEVGLTTEFYTKKIPQMALQKDRQFFVSAFVSILFGRRK